MKVRKIVAGLAAVSMLAAFSAQTAFAADSVTIKAGEAKAAAGENFTLEISLAGVPAAGTNAVEFAVTYDSKAISITGVKAGAVAQTGVEKAEKLEGVNGFEAGYDTAGLITISYSTGLGDAAYAMGDGVFAVISGKVAAGTADGEYPIKITAIERETVEGKGDTNKEIKAGLIASDGTVTKYSATGVNGAVIVGTPTPTQDTTQAETPETGEVKYCDVNNDGLIDIMDIILFNKWSLGIGEISAQGMKNADVNADGTVDSNDGLNILKRIVDILSDADFPIKK